MVSAEWEPVGVGVFGAEERGVGVLDLEERALSFLIAAESISCFGFSVPLGGFFGLLVCRSAPVCLVPGAGFMNEESTSRLWVNSLCG